MRQCYGHKSDSRDFTRVMEDSDACHNISSYLKLMDQVFILHIYQEANMAADYLVKMGHTTTTATTWEFPPTIYFKAIMYADLMGRAPVKRGV